MGRVAVDTILLRLFGIFSLKTVRHFPRFGVVDTLMDGSRATNLSLIHSLLGNSRRRSITELVDKATLIFYIEFIDFFIYRLILHFFRLKTEKRKSENGSTSKKRAHVMYRYNTCSIHVLLELVHVHTYVYTVYSCTAENTRYQMRPHVKSLLFFDALLQYLLYYLYLLSFVNFVFCEFL